jgi:hypothetical protein
MPPRTLRRTLHAAKQVSPEAACRQACVARGRAPMSTRLPSPPKSTRRGSCTSSSTWSRSSVVAGALRHEALIAGDCVSGSYGSSSSCHRRPHITPARVGWRMQQTEVRMGHPSAQTKRQGRCAAREHELGDAAAS